MEYTEAEANARFEAALRGSRLVGHKPQSEMKLGKRSGKPPTAKKPVGGSRKKR